MEIRKWVGLHNTMSEERLSPGMLSVARDVDIDSVGAIRTRTGMTSVDATASHSMFAAGDLCVLVQGQDMKRMDPDGTLTQLRRLTHAGPVSYAESNGVVYFTNGVDTGRIQNGTALEWGVRPPISQPSAAGAAGILAPGRYMYAMTFVRSDGMESGTRHAGVVELSAEGGIMFSDMETSSNPEVVAKALYVSGANGEELYRVAVVPSATSTFWHYGDTYGTVPLERGFVEQAPAGSAVEVHGGVAYVADGDTLWYSELYSLERFRRADRFMRFPGNITMVLSAGLGLFVATANAAWYLAGTEPTSLVPDPVLAVGAIPGTGVKLDAPGAADTPDNDTDPPREGSVMWLSSQGVMIAKDGGEVRYLSVDDYGIPSSPRAAALYRVARGYASYIVTLQGATTPGSAHP